MAVRWQCGPGRRVWDRWLRTVTALRIVGPLAGSPAREDWSGVRSCVPDVSMLTDEVDRGFREFASMNPRSKRCREARATRPHRPGGLRGPACALRTGLDRREPVGVGVSVGVNRGHRRRVQPGHRPGPATSFRGRRPPARRQRPVVQPADCKIEWRGPDASTCVHRRSSEPCRCPDRSVRERLNAAWWLHGWLHGNPQWPRHPDTST